METTCQRSYPRNSENASPPGTCTVYLSSEVSCAVMVVLPRTAIMTATASVTETEILRMAHSCARGCVSRIRSRAAGASSQRQEQLGELASAPHPPWHAYAPRSDRFCHGVWPYCRRRGTTRFPRLI